MPDTDWHVDEALSRSRRATGATLITATHSRYVVDLNRDPSGAALYPGRRQHRAVPDAHVRQRADLSPRRRAVAARDRRAAARRSSIRITRARARDRARARTPWLCGAARRSFDRRARCRDFSPDGCPISISAPATARAATPIVAGARRGIVLERGAASRTSSTAASRAATSRATTARRRRGVHALQLEMAQACYMDEAAAAFDAARAARAGRACSSGWCARSPNGGPQRCAAMIRFYIARQRYDAYLRRRPAEPGGHPRARVQRARVEHRRRRAARRRATAGVDRRRRRSSRARERCCARWKPTPRATARRSVAANAASSRPANFELCWNCGRALHNVG